MAPLDLEALALARQPTELVQHAHATAQGSGDGRSRHAEFRKRTHAKDQQRIEDEIAQVRDPERAHRDGRVTRATKDRVDQKQQQDDEIPREHHPRITLSHCDDLG
jgi:hypothetical protein